MTFANPLKNDFNAGGGVNRGQVADDMNLYVPIALDGQNPQDYVASTALYLIYGGKLWKYDSTDTTSAHDGVTVIVTSDSRRYKCNAIDGQGKPIWSVQNFSNTPAVSPTAGNVYGVGPIPTGVWASYANYLAIALVGGGSPSWAFVSPTSGLVVFDISQTLFRSYTGSAWVDGLGLVNATGSVAPEACLVARFSVQSQSATPPGSPTVGQYFLVGASATGAWSGHDQQVAKCTNATGPVWAFYTAATGWTAWNIATSHEMVFSSGAWIDALRPRIIGYPPRAVRTTTVTGSGSLIGFTATAPTSAAGALVFPEGSSTAANYALTKATNRLVIRVKCQTAAGNSTIAVFKDGQASCDPGMWDNFSHNTDGEVSQTAEFEVSPGDTSSHTWNIRAYGPSIYRAELQFIEIET